MVNGSTSRQESTGETLAGQFEPRSGVKALVTSDRAVLLVKEHHSDGTPFWTLPGGGVRAHETHAEGLRRELVEELRCRAHVTDRVSTFWYAHDSLEASVSVYTVFDCDLFSAPEPNPAEGVFDYRWAQPGTLPARTLPQVRYLCRNAVSAVVDD